MSKRFVAYPGAARSIIFLRWLRGSILTAILAGAFRSHVVYDVDVEVLWVCLGGLDLVIFQRYLSTLADFPNALTSILRGG
jgi:hypothetical protein